MNTNGLSLFQGADSIQLNTSAQQRIEEEDAREDQLRRNEEVWHIKLRILIDRQTHLKKKKHFLF